MSKADDRPRRQDYRSRVVVKFRDDVELPYDERVEDAIDAAGVGPWRGMRERHPDIVLVPLFDQLNVREIESLVREAIANDVDYRPPNLLSYFVVVCPPDADAEDVAGEMRRWKTVENAYVEGGPTAPPAVNAGNDPRSANQRYLDPAPDGIDAEYAWTKTGGDGAGIGFVDLEQGWTLNHEDLIAAGITLISGSNTAYHGHGTAVLGEVVAVDNTIGCVGIAPQATARVVSQYQPSGYNTARAVLSATATMSFGDVLLLEAQTTVAGTSGYLPVEVENAVFDAIRLATALGIVVVEAAGNGSNDLDTFTLLGQQILNRSAPGFRDSGAIMVGAASSTVPHTRLAFSNFGSRIDCYAWGDGIDTTGDGWTGTATNLYTTGFGGTSGASPIITGAAILEQSISVATQGFRYSPRQLRAILTQPNTGTSSGNPAADRLGVMPNLRQIIDNVLSVRPDVYLRDFVGDTGEAHLGAISASPDIILRPAAVGNPQATFGAGSGTENDATLGAQAEAGQDNFLYVRVRNQGGVAAANVVATVYWSPVSTLVTPNLWTLVGSNVIGNVPQGELLTVSNAITWPAAAIPAPGHYCFVGTVHHPDDPAPQPGDLTDWANFQTYIRNNNNVTWRNFNVVNNVPPAGAEPPGYVQLPFLIAGAPDRARVFDLDVIAKLPGDAEVLLELPRVLAQAAGVLNRRLNPANVYGRDDERAKGNEIIVVPLTTGRRNRIAHLRLGAEATFPLRLLVRIPEDQRVNAFEVVARQLYEGEEVGRVTWQLVPRS